jgi:cytochrome P450
VENIMATDFRTDAGSRSSLAAYAQAVAAAPRCPVVHGVAFDPVDPAQADDPYPWLRVARNEAPVFYLEKQDVWVVTRYADMLSIMRDDATFSSRNALVPKAMTGPLAEVFPDGHPLRHSLLLKDPPQHHVIRRLVQRNFTPQAVARYEGMIRERANRLIEAFIDDGQCDLVAQFSGKLPGQVVCAIIGIPDSDSQQLASWSEDSMLLIEGAPPLSDAEREALANRAAPVMAWLTEFVEARRAAPRDDLTSDLLQAATSEGGPALSTEVVVGFIDSLLIAGVGTTKNFIASAVRELLSHRDQWEQIKADRSLLENALEECLRLRTPSRGSRRMTTREVELGGVHIPKGAHIHMMLHSAQRDETIFDHPDELDIHRANVKEHFAFGRWTHMCLGSNLARLEGRIAFEAFLDRMSDMRLVPNQDFEWTPNMTIPHFKSLLVEW